MTRAITIMQFQLRHYWGWVIAGGVSFLVAVVIYSLFSKRESPQENLSTPRTVELPSRPAFPYNLQNPVDKQKLPEKLEEVSGLSYIGPEIVGMVQDEKGKIYFYDHAKEEVVKEVEFEDEGDFEGLEMVGKDAYIIQSDGILYETLDVNAEKPSTRKYRTPFTERNNIEGLGYLSSTNELILACKEEAGIYGKKYKYARALYTFSLDTKELIESPFLIVNLYEVSNMLSAYAATALEKETAKDFDPQDNDAFKPSAVAQHPITGEIYIIGSVGKLMLQYDTDGKLLNLQALDKELFKQPEGICFAPDGTMFIANEGKNGKGNLLIFPMEEK